MRFIVEASPIRPGGAAGLEAFTYGLLDGLTSGTDHAYQVNVLRGTMNEWRERVPTDQIRWQEVTVPLQTDTRYGQLLRRWTPHRVRESRTVRRTMNAVRQRAAPDVDDANAVLFPFPYVPSKARHAVIVLHDLRPLHAAFHSPGFEAVVRQNVARAAAIVVCWPHPYQDVLATFPEAAERTALIPPPTFQPAPDGAVAQPEPGLLLYPSSTSGHKNHATLLEAMALLPEFRLICPGPLAEPQASRLLRRAAMPDLAGRVSFPGFVPLAELNRLYARADAVVVPSTWEAASGPMLEAFSWGLPVACSDAEPLLAQLRFSGAEAAVFEAKDPRSLAAAVRRLVADRGRYAAASRKANDRLAARTWAETGRDYGAVLEWVAAGSPGPLPRSPFAEMLTAGRQG
ncbi:glycosyltransferase [Micromonospora sp. NPDC000089]|uniref:glycosyltransferase n=1 Tax=unclassified Micromonospora TaxID=2617518 RepID=UPI003691CDD6